MSNAMDSCRPVDVSSPVPFDVSTMNMLTVARNDDVTVQPLYRGPGQPSPRPHPLCTG